MHPNFKLNLNTFEAFAVFTGIENCDFCLPKVPSLILTLQSNSVMHLQHLL
jgi:hypothetical protein